MCTYNGEKYLSEQIDSILDQKLEDDDENEVKLFIVDDGSSDDTTKIIDEYISANVSRIARLKVSNHHEGAKNNFFKGLISPELRQADYVMLSDQDDIWNDNKISTTLKRMKEVERQCGEGVPVLVHCDCRVVDGNLNEISPSFTKFANFNQKKATFNHLLVQNLVTGAASMMNKALMELIIKIPKNCMMHDHFIALVASAFGHISYIDEPLYKYRQHDSNVLSAVEGGITKEVRLWKRREHAKKEKERILKMVWENYHGMKLQAESFFEIYNEMLDENKRKIVSSFVNISNKPSIMRVFTILRYDITCDNWYRIIGECSFFLRNKI